MKSAVGFDQTRNDNVTVISRKFAGADGDRRRRPAWYDNAWLPIIARNVTAIVIALLVLFLGVRPLAKALMKKRDDAAPVARPRSRSAAPDDRAGQPAAAAPVSLDQLESDAAAMTTASARCAASRATIRRARRSRCAT